MARLPVYREAKELRKDRRGDWVTVSVCMNPEMKRALYARAEATGRSMAAEVRHLLASVLVADGAGPGTVPGDGDQVDQVNWWDELMEATGD